jgi:hypothetical protein
MRQLTFLVSAVIAFFILFSLFVSHSSPLGESVIPNNAEDQVPPVLSPSVKQQANEGHINVIESGHKKVNTNDPVVPASTQGHAIMPHLGNETLKYFYGVVSALIRRAELGRASWKFLHTVLARFPERPTPDEREALKSFIHLFARLYPCGEWYYNF